MNTIIGKEYYYNYNYHIKYEFWFEKYIDIYDESIKN